MALEQRQRLAALFSKKIPPQPGDWLDTHREAGQTLEQYLMEREPATKRYSEIMIVKVGEFSQAELYVVEAVKEVIAAFFGLRLVQGHDVPIARFPASAQRRAPYSGQRQLLAPYIRNEILLPVRTAKAAAILGITAMDLWPGAGWNFVFGQASLKDRVGVWSMARNGSLDRATDKQRAIVALRTAKTATHEIGHMLGIPHCVAFECGMNGNNHVTERDRQPLEFCPECQPKVLWTCGLEPRVRSIALATLAERYRWPVEAALWKRQTEVFS